MVAIGDPLPEQGNTGKLLHDTQEYAGLCALSTNPTRDRVRCELEQISYLLVSDFCELTGRPDCTSPSPPSPSSCPPWPSEPSHNANSHVSSSARLFPLSGQDLAKISSPWNNSHADRAVDCPHYLRPLTAHPFTFITVKSRHIRNERTLSLPAPATGVPYRRSSSIEALRNT